MLDKSCTLEHPETKEEPIIEMTFRSQDEKEKKISLNLTKCNRQLATTLVPISMLRYVR